MITIKALLDFKDAKCREYEVAGLCDMCPYQCDDCVCAISKLITKIRKEEYAKNKHKEKTA